MTIRLLILLSFLYLLLILITYVWSYPFFNSNPKLKILFFDVGQGDSIYIQLPTGERLLLDGGETFDLDYKISKEFIFPFCNFENIFLSHPHLDHYGGLVRVTQHCNFNNFTFNDIQCKSKACNYFSRISTKNSILLGDKYVYKGVTIKVLWPDLKNTNIDYSNLNNLSVILFLDYGDFEALFTGDAEAPVLDSLDLSSIVPLIQNGLDIYKVPHHGAKNSLSFKLLNQLKPRNCIISVGAGNKYGHPHKEVLDYLNTISCKVYRTDISGDITFLW